MKKTALFISLLLVMASVRIVSAKADQPIAVSRQDAMDAKRSDVQQNIVDRRADVQDKMEERQDQVCQNVQARIQNRLNRYEENKDKYMARHQGVISRLTDLGNKLEDQGCDPAQIRTDLDTYNGLIQEFATAFRNMVTTMQQTKNYACGESQGQFSGSVNQTRQQLQVVQQKALALKNFFNNTLRLHLRQTAAACQQQLNSEEANQ